MATPARMYPVTLGSLSTLVTRDIKNPASHRIVTATSTLAAGLIVKNTSLMVCHPSHHIVHHPPDDA